MNIETVGADYTQYIQPVMDLTSSFLDFFGSKKKSSTPPPPPPKPEVPWVPIAIGGSAVLLLAVVIAKK